MAILETLFGKGKKQGMTARQAHRLALEKLRTEHPAEAEQAVLSCLYTSVFDSNLSLDFKGLCRAWHVDFFLPVSRKLCLIRVHDEKTRSRDIAWEKTAKAPVEYVFAVYGMQTGPESRIEPPRVPDNWQDSPAVSAAVAATLQSQQELIHKGRLAPLALWLPAQHLRYLHEEKTKRELTFADAPADCFGVICAGEDLYEEDCYLLYLDALTTEIRDRRAFRFPSLFTFGSSMSW
jgi:hypothetical protein